MTAGARTTKKRSTAWLAGLLAMVLAAAVGTAATRSAAAEDAAARAGRSGSADGGQGGGKAAAQAESEAGLDPVAREVVRMLAGKVPEPVILRWLAKSGRRPATVGSDDLIALRRAGASAELLDKLLDLAGTDQPPAAHPAAVHAAPAAPAPATAAAPASPQASSAARAPAPASSAAPALVPEATAAPARAPAPPAAGSAEGAVRVSFNVEYRPFFGEDDDRWSLFVYLDGRYLASVKPAAISLVTQPLAFERSLAPGRHLVRLIEERHLRHPLGRGWQHQARVAPAALAFDLRPGAPAAVEIGLHEVTLRRKGSPLSLTVAQGEAAPAGVTPAVPPAARWPPLCEEVESAETAGKNPSAAARRQLEHCLRWADLWPGIPELAPRDRVRAGLERARFQPGPAVD
jgi:hypothetical protein